MLVQSSTITDQPLRISPYRTLRVVCSKRHSRDQQLLTRSYTVENVEFRIYLILD